MDDGERRGLAWDKAFHAFGTGEVFAKRARNLRRLTRVRDFLGIGVPICVAYLLGTEIWEVLRPYRAVGIGVLGVAALVQALVVVWSLLSRWDDDCAYSIRASRDSFMIKDEWVKLGNGDTNSMAAEFSILDKRQTILDSHDNEKGITSGEKQMGMRAALIEFQRKCVCGMNPESINPPFVRKHKCGICGGN